MRRFSFARMLGLVLFALSGAPLGGQAAPPGEKHDSDLLIRFNGPVTVATADTLTSVWVFGNEARVDGTLRDALVVVNGTARIEGAVEGGVVVIKGHLELGPEARIGKDVLLYGSTMTRASGAVVQGAVHQEGGMSFSARAAWFLWLSITLAILVAALAAVWLASPAIDAAGQALSGHRKSTVLTAVLLLIGLPAAAIASMATGVGLAVGLFIACVAIPVLAFTGYVVVGHTLGRTLLGLRQPVRSRPYLAVTTGILILQIVTIIPVVGALIAFVAAPVGAGALVFHVWTVRRGERTRQVVAMQAA